MYNFLYNEPSTKKFLIAKQGGAFAFSQALDSIPSASERTRNVFSTIDRYHVVNGRNCYALERDSVQKVSENYVF